MTSTRPPETIRPRQVSFATPTPTNEYRPRDRQGQMIAPSLQIRGSRTLHELLAIQSPPHGHNPGTYRSHNHNNTRSSDTTSAYNSRGRRDLKDRPRDDDSSDDDNPHRNPGNRHGGGYGGPGGSGGGGGPPNNPGGSVNGSGDDYQPPRKTER